jgi:hypothetical protein
MIFTSFYLERCIWPDAISWQRVNVWGASSDPLRRCNLLVQSYLSWRDLDLMIWSWDKATVLPVEKSKFTETKEGDADEEQIQEHTHHFLWLQGDRSKLIRPGGPKSEFRVLLWRFTATVWKRAKILSRTLATKELAVASRQCTVSDSQFHQGIFYQKQYYSRTPATLLTWFVPMRLSSVSPVEDRTEMPPFRHY